MQTVKIGIGYISARPIQIGKARLLAARPHVTACKTGWFHRAKGGALQGHGQAYAHPRRLDIIKNMHGIKLLILPQRACKPFGKRFCVDCLMRKAEKLHRYPVNQRPSDHHLAVLYVV